MPVTPEQARLYRQEADQVVITKQDVLGYLPVGDNSILFVVTEPIDEGKRAAIIKTAPDFKNVFFLTGISSKSYQEDPSVVQRVVGYGGLLPEWKISHGVGDWQDNQDKLDTAPNLANISVIPYYELAAKL